MTNEPKDPGADGGMQQVGIGKGLDRTMPEEVAKPGRKRTAADAEWLSIATADPAHFLKDLHAE
jgi:hypothetical protein